MNNFDTNTNNVNLELRVTWDTDLSQMWFDDVIFRVGDNDSKLFAYGVEDFDPIYLGNYNLKSATNKQLHTWLRVNYYGSSEDMKDDALNYFSKYSYQLTKAELIELAENILYQEDYKEFLEANFTPLFSTITTIGYNQGDQNKVVLPWTLFDNKEPTTKDIESYKEEIDRLFWDAPIDPFFTIDDEQFYITDSLKDLYSYDVKEILQVVKDNLTHEKKDYILNWLEENLPNDPAYI